MVYFCFLVLVNVLQVYSVMTKLQTGEGIARKAGSGEFPQNITRQQTTVT